MSYPHGFGITFGDCHSFKDLKMVLSSRTVGLPDINTETVTIPGRNGYLDLSETLTGRVIYGNRTLEFNFGVLGGAKNWSGVMSSIAAEIHGKKLKIIQDDDPQYYMIGRCQINAFKTNMTLAEISITCDCEPFRYEVEGVGEEWKWDPFSFSDGIIRESNYSVNESLDITLYNRSVPVSPIFNTSADMSVMFAGVTYSLPKGATIVREIQLQAGYNLLKLIGNGTVNISYRGGVI